MSTTSYALRDSKTMLRRNLKHAQRYPSMTISIVAMPILMLLLFVYVFGGALGNGIGAGDRGDYTNYVVPGIILMAVTSGAISTAVSVCTDMTEGIINRFRTMAISRASVLTGHVVGNVIQTLISLVLVIGVALAVGFRPNANLVEWIAALGILTLLAFSLSWVSAAMGLGAKTVEAASNAPMPLTFLPFLGSAVVTPESMPAGLRWFAEYQPFTPINETLRGLLLGTEIGNNAWIALAWGIGLSLLGYLWARSAFAKR
ncbi:ABC transporter permease (plasmid) [Streptomyces lunaelactis]|uniref:Transport permease protein n=1 Tax=Streptomyces lunaelactis TaxID=1535768 RepID=A0A2R4TFL4_9ACTN|nr:ABC transporter permease [Streptomyces lunaelactis]AVZ77922.1 ABC transporter permease [Streptomyces lunaelactis]NUK83417.1 ABC transporter permease [Streptomyces lunaelactis]NUL01702.1 ABC transporter permease [Streptomyces lunaelactis]